MSPGSDYVARYLPHYVQCGICNHTVEKSLWVHKVVKFKEDGQLRSRDVCWLCWSVREYLYRSRGEREGWPKWETADAK